MKYFKKLLGDRLYLSPRNTEDVAIFTEWMNDFETTDYIGNSAMLITLKGETDFLEGDASPVASFVIVTLADNKMIGTVSIENISWTDRSGSLGIFIGDKEYRSQGYGTEAIRLILEYGFHYLNLHSIRLEVMEFNERAIKCYQKCGFKETGRRRKCKFIHGNYYDNIMMDILEDEFEGQYIRNKNV